VRFGGVGHSQRGRHDPLSVGLAGDGQRALERAVVPCERTTEARDGDHELHAQLSHLTGEGRGSRPGEPRPRVLLHRVRREAVDHRGQGIELCVELGEADDDGVAPEEVPDATKRLERSLLLLVHTCPP